MFYSALLLVLLVMIRRSHLTTRPAKLCPYTKLFRSGRPGARTRGKARSAPRPSPCRPSASGARRDVRTADRLFPVDPAARSARGTAGDPAQIGPRSRSEEHTSELQ